MGACARLLRLLSLLLPLLSAASCDCVIDFGDFNVTYSFNVSSSRRKEFAFTFTEAPNVTNAIRISTVSEDADEEFPVLVVAKQQSDVVSWRLPLFYNGEGTRLPYFIMARTLCPTEDRDRLEARNQTVFVEVTTQNPNSTTVSLDATLVENFSLQLDEPLNVTLSPSRPKFHRFAFPPGVASVRVSVDSSDERCMRVSVQPASCPVYDLARNIDFRGMRQTASKKASLSVTNDSVGSEFYVVMVVYPTEKLCKPGAESKLVPVDPSTHGHELFRRTKRLTLTIRPTLETSQYFLPVFGAIALFCLFYLVAFAVSLARRNSGQLTVEAPLMAQEEPVEPAGAGRYAACGESLGGTLDDFVDVAEEANKEKEIFRLRADVTVFDMARKPPSKLSKKYKLYYWYLIIISIFYCLPVAQLVLTYQKVLNASGDEDLCFYNFDCSQPLGVFSAFNNVFSNVGYVMLGFLFLLLCVRRDVAHQRLEARDPQAAQLGIPQHFGLFYAIGIGMIMEGVMSGCYHVCPSYNNFQFDTAFMYMLCGLCMLKIYQTRHPDVNASAHMSYMALAIVIFTGLLGVFYSRESPVFYSLFCCLVILASCVLTLEVYYVGRWRAEIGRLRRLYLLVRTDGLGCLRPQRVDRLVLLAVANSVNWSLAIFGAVQRPADFSTFMLLILSANMMMYFLFYVVMKFRNGERLSATPIFFIVLDVAAWAGAAYFFLQSPTDWEDTAASSRTHNQPCILLNFYDVHDVWHFLSAMAMFFGFAIVLTMDDDLRRVRRDKIRVF